MTDRNVPDLTDPALMEDPYGGYGRLRERGPVLRGRFLEGTPTWYVTRYDDVRAVLGDSRFANDPRSVPDAPEKSPRDHALKMFGVPEELTGYLVGTILDSDPPDHTRLRKLVSRTFTVRRVSQLRPRVVAITDGLLDRLPDSAENGVTDLIEGFAYPLPSAVICEMVGVPEADRSLWRDWGKSLVARDPKVMPNALRSMVDYVHDLIGQRRSAPTDDLLSGLIRTHDEEGDRLSDVEMVTLVFTLVLAGHETTAHLIGNGTVALLTHPEQLALLRQDPGAWPHAVHELMRWCGPVQLPRLRYATEDVELAGTLIERGDAVQAVIVSANFDPREFDSPDRFDITRVPEAHGEGHVGFGYGAHYCLGAALARQECEVALSALFERFPSLSLAVAPENLPWMPLPGNRRLARLPVRLEG
ncbi:cytochrome P450 family protein [Nocardiopsis ansamitocini]|uniref:Cytochrome P450 n=1 Tax=Nocardiopsis ansamitocini TaxID=1670832 RepID=A0A9W6UHV5_9ACTN|nr:cytochrome P450 [Nocardiopsis ansamitocini]GLU46400.1 cytochrome P450 [Nocardiopsis ansamitocini]